MAWTFLPGGLRLLTYSFSYDKPCWSFLACTRPFSGICGRASPVQPWRDITSVWAQDLWRWSHLTVLPTSVHSDQCGQRCCCVALIWCAPPTTASLSLPLCSILSISESDFSYFSVLLVCATPLEAGSAAYDICVPMTSFSDYTPRQGKAQNWDQCHHESANSAPPPTCLDFLVNC